MNLNSEAIRAVDFHSPGIGLAKIIVTCGRALENEDQEMAMERRAELMARDR
jgi:hypothetical protein